ncbi:hypothetical protein Gotur_002511 [Gossypium turneri]
MANIADNEGVSGKLLDNDEFEILDKDVRVSMDGPYPEIFLSDRIQMILDKNMEQTVIVQLLGRMIGFSGTYV